MFARRFFAAAYFAPTYFPPTDGGTPPVVDENVPLVGMLVNMGTMMGRR